MGEERRGDMWCGECRGNGFGRFVLVYGWFVNSRKREEYREPDEGQAVLKGAGEEGIT